jgi:hypothetical protein
MPYVLRNDNGAITGLFSVIQLGLAEELLTDETVEVVAFKTGDSGATMIDGQVVLSLNALKVAKLGSINKGCETALSAIKSGYPDSEVSSWPQQAAEAHLYGANTAAATPLLDSIATARSILKADLVALVLVKVELYSQASGAIIGKRQALEKAVEAIIIDTPENRSALELIAW